MRVCARRIGVVREADWELSPGRVEGGFARRFLRAVFKGGFEGVLPKTGGVWGRFSIGAEAFQVFFLHCKDTKKS